MNIVEIQNMTAADLKAKRDEVVQAVKDHPELAARFVQALTDAKVRDEKLAEQGTTISNLNAALAAKDDRIDELARQQAEASGEANKLAEQNERYQASVDELKGKVAEQTERAARLKSEASRNRSALNGAAKLLNDAIGQQQIEDVS